jgi:hypothetical protein
MSPCLDLKKLLKKHKFVKRKVQKSEPVGKCENRNEQFENIARLKKEYAEAGNRSLKRSLFSELYLWMGITRCVDVFQPYPKLLV